MLMISALIMVILMIKLLIELTDLTVAGAMLFIK